MPLNCAYHTNCLEQLFTSGWFSQFEKEQGTLAHVLIWMWSLILWYPVPGNHTEILCNTGAVWSAQHYYQSIISFRDASGLVSRETVCFFITLSYCSHTHCPRLLCLPCVCVRWNVLIRLITLALKHCVTVLSALVCYCGYIHCGWAVFIDFRFAFCTSRLTTKWVIFSATDFYE